MQKSVVSKNNSNFGELALYFLNTFYVKILIRLFFNNLKHFYTFKQSIFSLCVLFHLHSYATRY